jgi:hypothetical protein
MTNPYASGFGYNTAFEVTGFNYGNGVIAALGYSADRLAGGALLRRGLVISGFVLAEERRRGAPLLGF